MFTSDSALRESWLKHDYSELDCEVVLIKIRPNTFKMADGCGEEASAQKNKNWGYYELNCLVEYGPMRKGNGNYR